MEKIYGFNESKCLVEVYSKKEINDKIAIITGSKTNDSDNNDTVGMWMDYPNGFDVDNTIILSSLYSTSDTSGFNNGMISNEIVCTAHLTKSQIFIGVGHTSYGVMDSGTYLFKLVLMKVD